MKLLISEYQDKSVIMMAINKSIIYQTMKNMITVTDITQSGRRQKPNK